MERELELWKAREVARLLALVETERRYYQEIVASIPVGILILSADLAILSANREVRKVLGLRAGEPLTGSVDQFLPAAVVASVREVVATGTPHSTLIQVPGEPERQLRVSMRQIRNWDDDPQHEALLTIEEVDPAGAARPDGDAGEVPAVELLDSLNAAVWAVDLPAKRFLFVNREAAELLGHPAAKWLNTPSFWSDRIHPADREWVLQAYEDAILHWPPRPLEFRALNSHGQIVWLRESARLLQDSEGRARHMVGISQDITQRHLLENQFVQAQRVEAASRLAQRVAKEITNQVIVISGYAEEMMSALDPANPLRADMQEIAAAGERLRAFAGQISAVNRSQPIEPAPVNLTALLRNLEPSIRKILGDSIQFELKPSPGVIGVQADHDELERIVETLAAVARNNAGASGKVTIECSPCEIEERHYSPTPVLARGVYAVIVIEDDGPTMPEETRAALFENFLATPEMGQPGLGPALARAYRLVRQWGGGMWAFANPVRGNGVQILLPRAGERLVLPVETHNPRPAPEPAPPQPAESVLGLPRPQTILVAEADSAIRALVRKMLQRQSYNVLEAGDVAATLRACEQHAGKIELLIADPHLAGLATGPTLANLQQFCPNLKVLYLSAEPELTPMTPANAALLQKPFTLGSLIAKVKEVLAA